MTFPTLTHALSDAGLLLVLFLCVLVLVVWAAVAGFARQRPPYRPSRPAPSRPGEPDPWELAFVRPARADRRVRAGGTPPTALPASEPFAMSARQLAQISGMAASAARIDHRLHARPMANPYPRHSRAAAVWSVEYAAAWQQLAEGAAPAPASPAAVLPQADSTRAA